MNWIDLLDSFSRHPLVVAIAAGLVLLKVQLFVATRKRQQRLVEDIVSSRGDMCSFEHIKHINSVPVVFSRRGEADIREAKEAYIAHLRLSQDPNLPYNWSQTADRLLDQLIIKMSRKIPLRLDRNELNDTYSPTIVASRNSIVSDAALLLRAMCENYDPNRPLLVRFSPEEDGPIKKRKKKKKKR